MTTSDNRTVRIFLSSTFLDFAEERDLLVQRVFPLLRGRLKDRFVELVDVDLRWGITEAEAERGEVLPICLAEIDRSRPYFVGLLGERYGWVPPHQKYGAELLEQQPWLEKHRGGKSITELEILHGVLRNPEMADRAFFYFRAPDYARKKGGDYLPDTPENAKRQADLKERIRKSGLPVVDYSTPEAFAERLESDLWKVLDVIFPADEVPDEFERESLRHEAYALPRRRLYLGGDRYIKALGDALAKGAQRVLIEGASGSGKSALIANWLEHQRKDHPKDLVHSHYLSASAGAADPVLLVRRLIEFVKRVTGSREEIPRAPQGLLESLPVWFAYASAYAGKEEKRLLVLIDGLNALNDLRDLRWLPSYLPEHVHLVVSSLPGEVLEALKGKGDWGRIAVEPLTAGERKRLLVSYLAHYDKTLSPDLVDLALSHPLGSNPLFLRTIAEEMRLFGVHEKLKERLDYYLGSKSIDDLFERVLARVEENLGEKIVRAATEGIWGSRSGLTEEEILGLTGLACDQDRLAPATWAPIRCALDEALLESGGRMTFAHDYMRIAISDRYLAGNNELIDDNQSEEALKRRRALHARLAFWFETRPVDARAAEEVPYQWRKAEDWERLEASLTRRDMFEAVHENRSNEELLSYWLDLEAEAGADLERDYERAWNGWDLDQESKETGDLAFSLGDFLSFAGRYRNFTERLARLSLEIDEKVLGAEHHDTSVSLNALALLLRAKGDAAAAEQLFRRMLATEEKVRGPEDPSTAATLNNLALLIADKGDSDAAEPLYRRALAITEKAFGAVDPDTGTSLNNLALLLADKGDYEAAEPLYRRALAIAEKAFGAEHPDTGTILNNLGGLLQEKHDLDAAEPLYRRALAIAEQALGVEHPDTGRNLNNLASLLKDKGDFDAAEPLYRRALAIAEKALGAKHPNTAATLYGLGTVLKERGNQAGAEECLRGELQIAQKIHGPDSESVAKSLSNLGVMLRDSGRFDKSAPLLQRAVEIIEQIHGTSSIESTLMLSALAELCFMRGEYERAEAMFLNVLDTRRRLLPPEDERIHLVETRLADLYERTGRFAEAAKFRQRRDTWKDLVGRPEDAAAQRGGPSNTREHEN